jgi:hypothetical protein
MFMCVDPTLDIPMKVLASRRLVTVDGSAVFMYTLVWQRHTQAEDSCTFTLMRATYVLA